jgi:hypothetical protein
LRKGLAVGIIFLFLGIAVAPSANLQKAKASNENDFIRVTAEGCGTHGYGPQAVTLTKQQYNDMEHLIGNIRERLRDGMKNWEIVTLFKDMVVILNQYALLPKGMTPEQAQRLIVGPYENSKGCALGKNKFSGTRLLANQSNSLCLIAGVVHDGFVTGPLKFLGIAIVFLGLALKSNFTAKVGFFLMGIGNFTTSVSPVLLLTRVNIHVGNITSIGLNGVKNFVITEETSEGVISGFTGIKITRNDTGEMTLLGAAFGINA